jgi:pimeloyl-ACP methyl ester carboxylesterase
VEVNGTQLHYEERGEGEPVVFVHGGLSDFRTWGLQMEPFSRKYRAIAYSRRGHYPNTWPEGYSASPMAPHVEDLAALIEALELGRVHIVANSYGGFVSLFLALRRPDLVRTLVLGEPPVHPLLRRLPGGEALFQEFMEGAWRPAGRAFSEGELAEGVRHFLEGAVGRGAFEEMPHRVRQEMMKNAPELKAATATPFEVHMPDLTCEELSRIDAPTLLLLGAESPPKYRLINNELARCLPHAEQVTIAGASHILHSHNPHAHNEAVLAFLARH